VKVARPRSKLKTGVAPEWPEPSPKLKRGRTMEEYSEVFVGLDTSKLKISVAVADGERNGEVRFFGEISAEPASVAAMVAKLAKRGAKLHFCYEAGPTGYDLHRQITGLGHDCEIVAPSLIPRRPGDRVKTNRRDAVSLARLHRAGELTSVWVPDAGHEAVRDLVRAREAANDALKKARQHLQAFLLRHGRIYRGRTPWTRAHIRWLTTQAFTHPAHHIVLAEYIQAIEDAAVRLERLTKQVAATTATWSMAPVVEAYQAMRGVAFLTAVTFVVEIGDVRRFETAPQLMAYLGLVPSESSTGERVRRGRITKAGNMRARRVLIEGAWTYRFPARVSPAIQARADGLPRSVREIAWKAQIRLCARYRKLITAGKLKTVAVTAIAREMAGFLWAIGQEVAPAGQA
jgi:transposase